MKAKFGWTVVARGGDPKNGILVYKREVPADSVNGTADLAPFTHPTKKEAREAGERGEYAYKRTIRPGFIIRIGRTDDAEGWRYASFDETNVVSDRSRARVWDNVSQAEDEARLYTWGHVIPTDAVRDVRVKDLTLGTEFYVMQLLGRWWKVVSLEMDISEEFVVIGMVLPGTDEKVRYEEHPVHKTFVCR